MFDLQGCCSVTARRWIGPRSQTLDLVIAIVVVDILQNLAQDTEAPDSRGQQLVTSDSICILPSLISTAIWITSNS